MRFELLLLLASAVAALGCNRSQPAPVGVNFEAGSNPAVTLNKNGESWRLFVDGVDVTAATTAKVTVGPAEAYYDVELANAGPASPLPNRFRIALTLDGKHVCQAVAPCPAGYEMWRRSATKK